MTNINKKNYNNLKDYVVAYQSAETMDEKNDVLSDFIINRIEKIDGDEVRILSFADTKMNEFLFTAQNQFEYNVPREDVEAFIMQFLFDYDESGNEIGMFSQIDTSYDPAQIINWLSKRFFWIHRKQSTQRVIIQ